MEKISVANSLCVWKFREFSVTQILREINFGECRSSTNAIFAILWDLNFVLANLGLQKWIKFKMCYK